MKDSLRRATLLFLLLLSGVTRAGAADAPATPNYAENWPRFRGPQGSGVSASAQVPVTCDIQSGENIAWSVPVPVAGFGSPVVWGDRVFLSGGDENRCEVLCFDATSGRLLWEKPVPKTEGSPDKKPAVPDQSGMAAGTVATDGKRVYAMFADGDLAAFNFDGTVAWAKFLGVPKNAYGHATSLLTWQDRLILQFDQGEADDHLSKLYAFDGATGEVIWAQERPVGASWATPVVFEAAGKPQIVTAAVPWVIAYNPQDGAEIWRAECLDGEVTPSPVFAGGLVLAVSPGSKLQSIRPDGEGDITSSHLGWLAEDGIPAVTSPVSNGELVFVVDAGGLLTCYDAKTGRKQWDHDLGDECLASPSIAGHKLYVITGKGTMFVAEVAREYQELGQSSLGEKVSASPAFGGNRMFVRGEAHLICIAGKSSPGKP